MGTLGPGNRDPSQSLKLGPQDSLQNLKVEPQDPLQNLKVRPPHLSLMNSFFSEYFFAFLLLYFLAFFKQDTKSIN